MACGTILHVNAVGFAAAIEANMDGSLRDRPCVIANDGAVRAVVLDLSPVAYREGIRRGMALSVARQVCSELEIRRPRPDVYRSVEETLRALCLSYTPLVEPAGAGHLYVDLAGTCRINGAPEDAAQKLRAGIYEATGLTPSIALATNKTTSKVATRVFRPAGFIALSPNEERPLLRRQPVGLLPGVGPLLRGRLSLLDVDEIGTLADLSVPEALALGPRGPELVARAQGVDESPVDPDFPERRSVSADTVLEPDTSDPGVLHLALVRLAGELAFKLRRESLGARAASVSIVYTDGATGGAMEKSMRLCTRDDEVLALALAALERATSRRVRIRRLCLGLSFLASAGPELDLFEPADAKRTRLQAAVDRVHARYGFAAVVPCATLGAAWSVA